MTTFSLRYFQGHFNIQKRICRKSRRGMFKFIDDHVPNPGRSIWTISDFAFGTPPHLNILFYFVDTTTYKLQSEILGSQKLSKRRGYRIWASIITDEI